MTAPQTSDVPAPDPTATGPDPILGSLVDIVDDVRAMDADTITLTLIVNGAVISGELLPARRWMKLVDKQLGGSTFVGERADELVVEAQLAWKAPAGRWTAEHAKEHRTKSQYVHLQNAHIVTGLGDYPATLWRVRLTDVSGWCYGALRTEPPEPQV